MKRKKTKIIITILLLALAFLIVYAAQDFYRVQNRSDICEHSYFRRVVNDYADDLFIPTKTASEWSAFRSNYPGNVSLTPIECCIDAHCGTNEECEDGFCVPIGCERGGTWYPVGHTLICRSCCSYKCCGHWSSGRGRCEDCDRCNRGNTTCRSSGNWSSCDADEPTCPTNECYRDNQCDPLSCAEQYPNYYSSGSHCNSYCRCEGYSGGSLTGAEQDICSCH